MNEAHPIDGNQISPPAPATGEASEPVIALPPLPPLPAPPATRSWTGFEYVLGGLLLVLAFLLGSFTEYRSEIWLHLATGKMLVQGEYRFGPDPFSYASGDDVWVNHSWLYSVLQYAVYQIGGGTALIVVKALLGVALFFLFLAFRPRDFSPFTALQLAGLAILVISPRLLLAPISVSYLLFAITLYALYRSGALGGQAESEAASTSALWWLPVVFVLWVNMDSWFILGPVTVLLCFLGNAISAALGWGSHTDVKKLGLATALGWGACLLNPFHVHAFILPPELAYLGLGWLPAGLTGGGQALASLLLYDSSLEVAYDLTSPLRSTYWSEPAKGLNIAGLAYFVLLLVSLASFVPALVQSGVRISLARLLIYVVFMLLSMRQMRMIPLFAVTAMPIAILNFAELSRSRRRQQAADTLLSPNLARFAVTIMVVLALVLTWPGWLHGPIGQPSRRHVAWEVHEDESHRRAAQELASRAGPGVPVHVFNFGFAFPNYCAWFAPQVKGYVDQRLTLFPEEAARYAKARDQLHKEALEIVERYKVPTENEWAAVLAQHKVDHIALQNIIDPQTEKLTVMCWLRPWHWEQRYGDGQVMVFAWSPAGQLGRSTLRERANELAFGHVPEEERAPLQGAPPPLGELPWWQQYVDRELNRPAPRQATRPYVWWTYFNLVAQRWRDPYLQAWTVTSWSAVPGMAAAGPGSVVGMYTLWSHVELPRTPPFRELRAEDRGPPGAPLLMIRDARQAVAMNRYDALAHKALYFGYKGAALGVEERWSYATESQISIRSEIRDVQLAASLRNYLDLRPEDWPLQLEYARLLYQLHQLDAGLEAYGVALAELHKVTERVSDRRVQEALRNQAKQLTEFLKQVERDVKRRRGDYEEKSARFKNQPLQKFRMAMIERYETIDINNKDIVDPRGRGLALEALRQLESVPLDNLSEAEKAEVYYWKFRLLMHQGRVGEAAAAAVPEALGPRLPLVVLWQAAATGDYRLMAQTTAELEKTESIPARRQALTQAALALLPLHAAQNWPQGGRVGMTILQAVMFLEQMQGYASSMAVSADLRTLRGIIALEQGDTAAAQSHFEEALNIVGPDGYFAERPVAERYLALIRAQR